MFLDKFLRIRRLMVCFLRMPAGGTLIARPQVTAPMSGNVGLTGIVVGDGNEVIPGLL
jgi:hypothetical protein